MAKTQAKAKPGQTQTWRKHKAAQTPEHKYHLIPGRL